MSGGEKLLRLKIRLGISDAASDALLSVLLDDSKDFILGYTRRAPDQWLPCFDSAQLSIAAANFGAFGADGLKSRTEGSVSTVFAGDSGITKNLAASLDKYRLVKGL